MRKLILIEQRPEDLADPFDAVHDDVGLGGDLRRSLFARYADAQDLFQGPFLAKLLELAEGVEVRRIVSDEHSFLGAVLLDQGADRGAFVRPDGRPRLDDAASDSNPQAQPLPLVPDELHASLADLPRDVPVVDASRDALVFDEGA